MSPAVLSLIALIATLALSVTSRVNVGVIAIALAWAIGVYGAGLRPDAVIGGFPASLFITLAGLTFLFSVAKTNGALEALAERGARAVRGRAGLLPVMFFVLAMALSSVGPGAIASVALVAPFAMATGARAGIPNLLTAIVVGAGANSGNLSPISSTGGVVYAILDRQQMSGGELPIWSAMFAAHLAAATIAYALFGGLTLVRAKTAAGGELAPLPAITRPQWQTIVVTALWIAAVVVLKVNVGLSAFAAGAILILLGTAEDRTVIRSMPLDIILMVCGVTVLVALLETTGGLELFTGLLARLAGPSTINGVIAFVTGLISIYSSTIGVVLPAFLPTIPSLVQQVGGGDPIAIAASINVGSGIVDVSPLSTLGALCIAAVADAGEARKLFRQLLFWGLSMSVFGALFCQLFAGLFSSLWR